MVEPQDYSATFAIAAIAAIAATARAAEAAVCPRLRAPQGRKAHRCSLRVDALHLSVHGRARCGRRREARAALFLAN